MSDETENMMSSDSNQTPEHNGDDVEFIPEEDLEAPEAVIKKLRAALKLAQKEKQEYLEGWQRMRADVANAKRDEEKQRESFVKFAEEKLILQLLPSLESFSLATGNKEAWEALPQDWRVGMEYIYKGLMDALGEHGLSEILPKENDLFDPNIQTSVGMVETQDISLDHKIAKVLQRGYELRGKVLKPARVSVYSVSAPH